MIELFDGVTLQLVENWDEIVQMPNFRRDVIGRAADAAQLKIVGTYDQTPAVSCGLKGLPPNTQ